MSLLAIAPIATLTGLAVATFISALISALETTLFTLKEHHVAKLANDRPGLRKQVIKIARHTRESINEALFLSSVANMTLAILGFYIIREGAPLFPGNQTVNALLILGGIIFFGDLLPKLIALALPELVFRITIRPFLFLSPVLEKFVSPLAGIAEKIAKIILPAGPKPKTVYSDLEVDTLVEIRRDEGTLNASESKIIQDVIQLGNKTTKDCLTPRTDIFMLAVDEDRDEAAAQIRALRPWHWHVPVYENDPDTVIGLLDNCKFLHDAELSIRDALTPPLFIPETMNALDAFRQHLNKPRALAIIVDEYGGVEGLLGYAHFVEELLEDAAPAPESSDEILQSNTGQSTVSGDTRLDEISKALGIELEHEGLDTIGGLVFTRLGHLPKPGTIARFDEFSATVKKVEGTRITEVLLKSSDGSPFPGFVKIETESPQNTESEE